MRPSHPVKVTGQSEQGEVEWDPCFVRHQQAPPIYKMCRTVPISIKPVIFTFSKQSFNKSLDFCNRSLPHVLHKFDWQLPSSLARAIRFEYRTHSSDEIDSEPHLSRTCKTSLRLSVFKLNVPLFQFTLRLNRQYYNYILNIYIFEAIL